MIRCPSCGFENPDDGRFCTDCGTPLGTGAAPPPVVPAPADATAFLAALDVRLAQAGFEPAAIPAPPGLDRWLRRVRFEIVQVGRVTVTCGVRVQAGAATVAGIREFSRTVFGAATARRSPFEQMLVHPVLVAPAAEPGVGAFLESHWPTHLLAFEFPVVVAWGTRELLLHRSTPLWGAVFHAGFRGEAERWFAIG